MLLQRYYLQCLSHASYLVADEKTKEAIVIDPQRDIDLYVQEAADRGLTIKHVVLTHFHADFIAGHIELRDKFGATIYLGAKAEAEFDFVALADGDTIEFGDVADRNAGNAGGIRPKGFRLCSTIKPLTRRSTQKNLTRCLLATRSFWAMSGGLT